MITTSEVFDDSALAALIAAATVLGTDVKAGLFTNNPVITKKSVKADFTEPTYGSYAQQAVVMGPPFRDPVNGISSLSAALTWQQTGTPTAVIINGIFYVTGAAQVNLLGAEYFKAPIPLTDLLDAFDTVLQFIQSNENGGFTTVLQ